MAWRGLPRIAKAACDDGLKWRTWYGRVRVRLRARMRMRVRVRARARLEVAHELRRSRGERLAVAPRLREW